MTAEHVLGVIAGLADLLFFVGLFMFDMHRGLPRD